MELVVINQPRFFPYRKEYQIAKRVIDVVLCLLLLPVTFPLMAICALAIRIDSPGPALFIHERMGKGGGAFGCTSSVRCHTTSTTVLIASL